MKPECKSARLPSSTASASRDSQRLKTEQIQLLRRLFDALNPSSQVQDPWGITGLTQVVSGRVPRLGYPMAFQSSLENQL